MFEIGLMIAACVGVGRLADAEGRSAIVWGVITLGIGLACSLIPLPFLRVLLASIIAVGILMVAKARGR
jgi:hypothetical protein